MIKTATVLYLICFFIDVAFLTLIIYKNKE